MWILPRSTVIWLLVASIPLAAQVGDERELLKALTQQVNELQLKIKELETRLDKREALTPIAEPPVPQAATSSNPEPNPDAKVETPSNPLLSLRGFGDVGYNRQGGAGQRSTSFGIGQIDFFVTSRLADRFGLLMETVLEKGTGDELFVDLERFLFQYRHNRYFNVDVGRYHSTIGFYNTAYHHGSWFQTAASRPALFDFEDEGGLLPIHNVGVALYGAIPSRGVNLGYTVELGNGRDYRADAAGQARQDVGHRKSINLALRAKPTRLPGLELGASWYRDRVRVERDPIGQQILAAYGVYSRGRLELLNEFVAMRHKQEVVAAGGGGKTAATYVPGFYSQWSYRVAGAWRPYMRYEFANPSPRDPIVERLIGGPHFRGSQVGGLRYDFTEYAALKFEARRILRRSQPAETQGAVNLSFTF